MAKDNSLSALTDISARALDYPDSAEKNSQIRVVLDGFSKRAITAGIVPKRPFGTRTASRTKAFLGQA